MPNPTINADNLPPIPLTEEQRFLFDTRGWLLFPGVLSETEVKEMREFCYQLNQDRESIPEHHRSSIGGPLESLTDHPVVLGIYERISDLRLCQRELLRFPIRKHVPNHPSEWKRQLPSAWRTRNAQLSR